MEGSYRGDGRQICGVTDERRYCITVYCYSVHYDTVIPVWTATRIFERMADNDDCVDDISSGSLILS